MLKAQRSFSLKKLIIELIFLSGNDTSLKQPREFYGRLDADFHVAPTADEGELR